MSAYLRRSTRSLSSIMILTAAALLPLPNAQAQLSDDDLAKLRQRGAVAGWTFMIRESEATRRPLTELCGTAEPPNWRATAHFDDTQPRAELPATFDWRNYNGQSYCTPIRNQGGCGSCWAFGAMGAFECAILINDGVSTDLSEQWLLSCTSSGNCTTGGWQTTAYDYLRCSGWVDPCGGCGAIREADLPYSANMRLCRCPYDHPWCLDSWAVVGPQWGSPTVEQIKQAILDHGPVSTCVYADFEFSAYGGGIFNACTDNQWINHTVVLVGWDDNQGPGGVWFMRNSWGDSWGEGGYMRIAYGCSLIGYGTNYVVYTKPDCNNNGVRDADDIANGTSLDCNHNGIPDECDLASGASQDCNQNGIPDECDTALPLPLIHSDVAAVLGWTDIQATGAALTLGDNSSTTVTIPFTNQLIHSTTIRIANNGAIGVGGVADLPYMNERIPASNLFGGGVVALVPFWDDLDAFGGNVYWQVIGAAPHRTLIVEWYNRPHSGGGSNGVTFQVQAFERPQNSVFAQYLYADTSFQNSSWNNGASATVGMQMDAGHGRLWSYNQAVITPAVVLSVVADGASRSYDHNGNGVPDECEGLGDVNCDGAINFGDINPFVLALANPAAFEQQYPGCDLLRADINGDGYVDFADINPFVAVLSGL